jgi:hypothetical protein
MSPTPVPGTSLGGTSFGDGRGTAGYVATRLDRDTVARPIEDG